MNESTCKAIVVVCRAVIAVFLAAAWSGAEETSRLDLWDLAQQKASVHRFSTLFTAHDVRQSLSNDGGVDAAIKWCKLTAVSKVYMEVFRDGYQASRDTLTRARDRFRDEGFVVHGCVTPTRVGKSSSGWSTVSCYTNKTTQDDIEKIFRYAADLFDVVMIDDFWFTDCECDECREAKGQLSWSDYRRALMGRMSRERVMGPARQVNPRVQLIIKYPEWYDRFHERGYDVTGQSQLFDVTWIGTETRDPDNARWGKKPQYGAYWISQWIAAQARDRLGGGWFDPLGTTPDTYVEQARQTILGQCRESMLFCYGALHRDHGLDDVHALRREIPGLFALAELVRGETTRGVGTYKPAGSPAGDDAYIFNFLGMLGIPMTADAAFPENARSLLLTEHAAADPALEVGLKAAMAEEKPFLLTSALVRRLTERAQEWLSTPNVRVLQLHQDNLAKSHYGVLDSVRDLMTLPRNEADALRRPLLRPLGLEFSAPPLVSLYVYGDNKLVVESFQDVTVDVTLAASDARHYEPAVVLPPDADIRCDASDRAARITLPPRSLVALRASEP